MSNEMYFNGSQFVGVDSGAIQPDNKIIALLILFGGIAALFYGNLSLAVLIVFFYLIYKEVMY